MSGNNTNSSNNTNPLNSVLDKIALATEIVEPTQLFAMTLILLLGFYVINPDKILIPSIFIVGILGLYTIGQDREIPEVIPNRAR